MRWWWVAAWAAVALAILGSILVAAGTTAEDRCAFIEAVYTCGP